jgi:polyhydroxyalkanoate synthesis regulator phasin
MVRKTKSPGRKSDTGFLLHLEDSTRTAWLAGVTVYSTLQNVRDGVLDRMAHEIKLARTGAGTRVRRAINKVRQSISATRVRFDKRIGDAIAVPLDLLGIPTQKDVDKLSRRVVELNAAVKRLAHEHSARQVFRQSA